MFAQRKVNFILVSAICINAIAVTVDAQDRARRRTPIVEVFEANRDAVVNISTDRVQVVRALGYESLWDEIFGRPREVPLEQHVQSVGSGFVVHEDGYIVTNAHVVARTAEIRISFADKTTAPARIVSIDPEHDLAVLRAEVDRPLPYLRLARSDDLMIGETVIAIGNPLGLQHTVTSGIVSAVDRDLQFSRDVVYRGLIQTDAAINPGNSGGPLLNINGELIGVNTAIRGDAQNVGFAIPADRLWEMLPSMLDIERRQRVQFGLRVGGPQALVADVRAGSPAAAAGLHSGDRIRAFNGRPIRDAIDFYVRMLEERPGDKLELAYERGTRGVTDQARIELKEIPLPDGQKLTEELFGMKLIEFPDEIRKRYELPPDVGLFVDSVRRRSPADRVGIQPGDVISALSRTPVLTLEDAGLALEGVANGERVLVQGIRLDARPPFRWDVSLVAQK